MFTVTYRGGVKGIDAFQAADGSLFRRGQPVSGVSQETVDSLEGQGRHLFDIEKSNEKSGGEPETTQPEAPKVAAGKTKPAEGGGTTS